MAKQYPRTTTRSLCETCAFVREVVTPKGSRFLLCRLSRSDPAFPKYPPQPVVRCGGYQIAGVDDLDAKQGEKG
jgi:hypothetical protein